MWHRIQNHGRPWRVHAHTHVHTHTHTHTPTTHKHTHTHTHTHRIEVRNIQTSWICCAARDEGQQDLLFVSNNSRYRRATDREEHLPLSCLFRFERHSRFYPAVSHSRRHDQWLNQNQEQPQKKHPGPTSRDCACGQWCCPQWFCHDLLQLTTDFQILCWKWKKKKKKKLSMNLKEKNTIKESHQHPVRGTKLEKWESKTTRITLSTAISSWTSLISSDAKQDQENLVCSLIIACKIVMFWKSSLSQIIAVGIYVPVWSELFTHWSLSCFYCLNLLSILADRRLGFKFQTIRCSRRVLSTNIPFPLVGLVLSHTTFRLA